MRGPTIRLAPRVGEPLVKDTYLTDGRSLFRVVSPIDPRLTNPVALLEDCRTLAVDPYTADELFGMGLRRVRSGD